MKLSYILINQELTRSFTTHKQTIHCNNQFLVKIEYSNYVGLGTGLLPATVVGIPKEIVSALELVKSYISGLHTNNYQVAIQYLRSELSDYLNVISAVETALIDLVAKSYNVSVANFFGINNELVEIISAVSTSYSTDNENVLKQVEHYSDHPILKIKLAHGCDVKVLTGIRKIYKGELWVDVNGGWELNEAIKNLQVLHDERISLLEQPLKPCHGNYTELLKLKEICKIPLVADEDCQVISDLTSLAGVVDVVAIKLFKCGGPITAYRMCLLAKDLGLKVMLGCRTESVFGITATVALAALADYFDLDGHLDIKKDFCTGIKFTKGRLGVPSNKIGIGVELYEDSKYDWR